MAMLTQPSSRHVCGISVNLQCYVIFQMTLRAYLFSPFTLICPKIRKYDYDTVKRASKHSTCFEKLLQNDLNNNVARFTPTNQTFLTTNQVPIFEELILIFAA